MKKFLSIAVKTLLAAAVVVTAVLAAGSYLFRQEVAARVAAIFKDAGDAKSAVVTEADLAGLPGPVRRWLTYMQVIGKTPPTSVRLRQRGLFRQKQTGDWFPFEAEEYMTTNPPALIWYATLKPTPFITIKRRDVYYQGEGAAIMKLFALIPVADMSGAVMDQDAMLRYLGEIMSLPTAALSRYIQWTPIDAQSARARLLYHGTSATAVFIFDKRGRLVNMRAEREVEVGTHVFTGLWSTPVQAYGEINGVRVPVQRETVWKSTAGDLPYTKFKVTDIEYNRPSMY